VIVVADEDDCSANKALFGISASLGPLSSFRCTEQGVVCDGPDDLRTAGPRSNCRPRPATTVVPDVSTMINQVRKLKDAPDLMMHFAVVAGPSTPFAIGSEPDNVTPKLEASCAYQGPAGIQHADPAVRLHAAANLFAHHFEATICQNDLTQVMAGIGKSIVTSMRGDPCFDHTLASPASCDVQDIAPNGTTMSLQQCNDTSSNLPCWRIETNPTQCTAPRPGMLIAFSRGGTAVEPGTQTKVSCALLDDNGVAK
jgi:hypothetical protein